VTASKENPAAFPDFSVTVDTRVRRASWKPPQKCTQPADRPAESVTLWRGSKTTLRRRMSWTADRPRAEWFAARYATLGPSAVYQVSAPPDALLCLIGAEQGRGEDEYVINTRGLAIREAAR